MKISSLLNVLPAAPMPPVAPVALVAPAAAEPCAWVINHSVYFNGDCDRCRPQCGAFCCIGYGFVSLTEEEAKSGRYVYKEASESCGCPLCQRMRASGVKYTLLKQRDGSCTYLDGSRQCSIYADRPETCRQYSCKNVPFSLTTS
jgi:hypothetical protein